MVMVGPGPSPLQADRALLPIYQYRDDLLAAVDEHQVVVIVGETGSGKTTQIPQYLHDHGYSKHGKVRMKLLLFSYC